MITRLHHLEIGTKEPEKLVKKLVQQYGLSPCAHRTSHGIHQIVLSSGSNIFLVVTDLSDESLANFDENNLPHFVPAKTVAEVKSKVNSVYNVAFQVEDISVVASRIEKHHQVAPTIQSNVASDHLGSVRYLTVKSCVGDICHTLIDKNHYHGAFLPHFSPLDLPLSEYPPSRLLDLYNFIDHVAYGLHEHESPAVLEWYSAVLNFKRLMTNSQESQKDGYIVMAGDTGLCLRAMHIPNSQPPFSIVLAEPTSVHGKFLFQIV